jgi:cytochrome oxidase Cu insertion factor (SCO1/SenC/PrrC family)
MKGGRVAARPAVLAVVLAAVAGVAIGFGIHLVSERGGSGSHDALPGLRGQARWPPGVRPAPDFSLRDQNRQRITLSSLRGQNVVLAFLGSRCRRGCAAESRSLGVGLRLLPRSARPVLIVVSVDPEHDNPTSVRRAARRWGLTAAAGWHWLLGSRTELARVWASYRIAVRRAAVYLIDRHGFERAGLLYPFPPSWPAVDLRILERQG